MKKHILAFVFSLCSSLTMINYDDVKVLMAQEENYEQILDGAGFNKDEIYSLSEWTKRALIDHINDENFYYSLSKVDVEKNDEINTLGNIPSSDLTVILVASDFHYIDGYLSKLKVSFYYDWNNPPLWRLDDPICVTWDSNIFSLQANSFYKEDRYYRNGDYLHMNGSSYQNNNDTITWKAELKTGYFLGIGGTISNLYGYGEFFICTKQQIGSIDSFLYGLYVHSKTANASISLNEDVSYTVSGSNDQASINTQILS